ncbi:MAG TPA: menaquinone biosynthesis protein [Verrucomicrobiae bacterium]|nr:menaquinone biosynthesis protein [Verrucomicrobiae bacterium]
MNVNSLRISIVQYLNTAPLVRGFTHGPLQGKYQLSFTVPSQCAEALRSGQVDIAIIPAIELQRIDNLVVLPKLSIASKKSVRSLLLVSKKPIHDVRRIALDRSSRSTQALVRILCAKRWHISPEFFESEPNLAAMLEQADAALLIGDPALRLAINSEASVQRDAANELIFPAEIAGLQSSSPLFLYDVVEKWRALSSFPAVLAIWAARASVVTPEIVRDFQESLAFGLQHIQEISAESSRELNLPAHKIARYLTDNIDYTLDRENLQGLDRYFSFAAELGLIPTAKPLAFAAEVSGPSRYHDFVMARNR